MGKRKSKDQECKNCSSHAYYVFSKHTSDNRWFYHDEFFSKEEVEHELTQYGEPESIEYLVIKGNVVDVDEGVAIYPVVLRERDVN